MLKYAFLFPALGLLAFLTLLLGIWQGNFSWFVMTCTLTIAITVWGVFDIRLGYFVSTFFRKKNPSSKMLALTFDDGPTPYTIEILNLLRAYQVKATFFCIGKQMLDYPEIVDQLIVEGHTLGNHTFTHSQVFGFLNERQVVEELKKTDKIIRDKLGKSPKFFRPPFGVTNPSIAKAVKRSRHHVIGWSNRSLDTVTWNADKIFNRVTNRLKSGDIILFHDTSQRTVNVLKRLLPYLQDNGYTCVSVDVLLNLYAYDS